jgi:hypothetical protein
MIKFATRHADAQRRVQVERLGRHAGQASYAAA